MLLFIPLPWKRLEFALVACVAFSFWALTVLTQVKVQVEPVKTLVIVGVFMCSMLLLGFVNARLWRSIGTPALLLVAAIVSYVVIGSAVSLATDAELHARDLAREAYFLIITLAAILGGRWMLERIGVDALLKWMLVALMASCMVVVATPLLRDIGVLPEYRIPLRLTGAFSDPNDAGFIATMTVALASAFLHNRRQRPLAYAALVVGYAAAFLTISNTTIGAVGVILTLYILLNARRPLRDPIAVSLSVLGLLGVAAYIFIQFQGGLPSDADLPIAMPIATPTTTLTGTPTTTLTTTLTGTPTTTLTTTLTGTPIAAPNSVDTFGISNRIEDASSFVGDARVDRNRSLTLRVTLWFIGAEKAMESPVFGHGIYHLRSIEGAPIGHENIPLGVHNLYLALIGEAGVVPLALYLLALLFLMRLRFTMPASITRDSISAWVIVIGLFGISFQHLLTQGAFNFLIGLTCAMAGFLVQDQKAPTDV